MSVFGKLWTPGGSGGGGNNRSFVGPGLGWYLDEDYLLTLGNRQLGTITTGDGGSSGGGEPLSPNTQYTDIDLPRTNVFAIGQGNAIWIEISNVTSRVYWMFVEMHSNYSNDTIWTVAAVSKKPFSMSMAGYQNNPYPATKPPSSPAQTQTYTETLRGFSSWTDVYGIVLGYHGTAWSGAYWFDSNQWSGDIPRLFHESVSGTSVIDTGLGWYADPLYLMANAGVTATGQEGSDTPRTYYKAYDGVCVAAYINGDPLKGPIIVSTVEQNAMGYTEPSWLTPEVNGSFTYLGLTWYYYGSYWVVKSAVSSTLLPVINYDWASVADAAKAVLEAAAVTTTPPGTTTTAIKVQYGSGAFAFTKFPVSGVDTYVGLGVSSVAGNAEIAVNDTSASYTTRTLDGTTFTMYYTDQMAGDMTAYVPVIEVASMPSISNLSDYQTALFNAIVSASGLSVIT